MKDNTLLEQLKKRIYYNDKVFGTMENYDNTLLCLLEDSKNVALSLYAPYEDEEVTLPKKYDNWVVRCAIEIYNGIGTVGLKTYSENGISWSRDSGYISKELREEIEPMIGVITNKGGV